MQFENGTQGIVFNIEEDNIGIVILGDDKNIKEGEVIKREKQFFKVPTGKSLLGRVVDVFGKIPRNCCTARVYIRIRRPRNLQSTEK